MRLLKWLLGGYMYILTEKEFQARLEKVFFYGREQGRRDVFIERLIQRG